jgi:hypothetical protein
LYNRNGHDTDTSYLYGGTEKSVAAQPPVPPRK